jgi:hypothetical protein
MEEEKKTSKMSFTDTEIPDFLKEFYFAHNPDFSINRDYDEKVKNICAVILGSSRTRKGYSVLDKAFLKIIRITNKFFNRWYRKYRKIDFKDPATVKFVESKVAKVKFTPFEFESFIVRFKLFHTLSELLEVYEVLLNSKAISPRFLNRLNITYKNLLVEEFSDLFISVLLTAKRCGINLPDLHAALEKKFKERK